MLRTRSMRLHGSRDVGEPLDIVGMIVKWRNTYVLLYTLRCVSFTSFIL